MSLIIIWTDFVKLSLIFNSLAMGVSLSSIYALVFPISSEFDQTLTEKQASSIAIWGVVGEGILSPICAMLMSFISPDMYFVFILIMGVLMERAKEAFNEATTKEPITGANGHR